MDCSQPASSVLGILQTRILVASQTSSQDQGKEENATVKRSLKTPDNEVSCGVWMGCWNRKGAFS